MSKLADLIETLEDGDRVEFHYRARGHSCIDTFPVRELQALIITPTMANVIDRTLWFESLKASDNLPICDCGDICQAGTADEIGKWIIEHYEHRK